MLVPVGCGLEIAPTEMLPAEEYERVLHWFDDQSKTCPIDLKATCAPHYYRIRAQRLEEDRRRGDMTQTLHRAGHEGEGGADAARAAAHHGQHLSAMTRGCLAGTAVCFVSNEGAVYPCGYLPVSAGRHAHRQRFADIWNDSEVFRQLRDPDALEGKCGECRFQAHLRRLPRARVRGDRQLPRRGAVLPVPAGSGREAPVEAGRRRPGDPGDGALLKI